MMLFKFYSFLFFSYCIFFCLLAEDLNAQRVRVGAEVFIEKHLDSVKSKRVGVICNQTSILPNRKHLVDTLISLGVNITALFAPEHGIRGDIPAGEEVTEQRDVKTGIIVYSLYGTVKKPTPEMLANIDVLIFDLQDVGARFYTYSSTMAYCMMAAAENGKKFIVLDRPNPINGVDIEGPVLDLNLMSFVGLFPIPVRHGLTIGELALMIIGEGYLNPSNVDLTVIPMEGWKRTMWYDETGLPWVSPSPNMKTLSTAIVYPGTCLLEATNISEGRGSEKPFEFIGAPKLNSSRLISKLKKLQLPGVSFSPVKFTPTANLKTSSDPKFKNKLCNGIRIQVTDRKVFKPVLTGVMIIAAINELYPKSFILKKGLFDRLIGDEMVSDRLVKGKVDIKIFDIFRSQLSQYEEIRSKYLLYSKY